MENRRVTDNNCDFCNKPTCKTYIVEKNKLLYKVCEKCKEKENKK